MKKALILLLIIVNHHTQAQCLEIGQAYQGGIIFYVDETGEHGLIAAPMDIGPADWSKELNTTPIAQGIAIGTGKQNTENIMTHFPLNTTGAQLCLDFVLDGYDDWYLPSINELEMLYLHKDVVGNFNSNEIPFLYMSSSEWRLEEVSGYYDKFFVYDFLEGNGLGGTFFEEGRKLLNGKASTDKLIRPIRSF